MLFCVANAFAQSNEWPSLFAVPAPAKKAVDSVQYHVSTEVKVFQYLTNAKSTFHWTPRDSAFEFSQKGLFEISTYLNSDINNQFYDLSGSVIRKNVLPGNGDFGLEWTPTSYLNLQQSGGQFQTTGDFGPLARFTIRDIPVIIRGGLSGSGWDDSLSPQLMDSKIKDLYGAAGFYGAGSVGDSAQRLFDMPVYLNADVFGRSISQAGRAAVTGRILYADDIGSGDSLFASYGDSLSNGKENIWGSEAGQQRYSSTPWRIARSFQAAGGIKAKERFGLKPGIMYSYAENSVTYPNLQAPLSDFRQRAQTLAMVLHTSDTLRLTCSGGIRFTWGPEEWLFAADLTDAASAFSGKSGSLLDSLQTKLLDHQKSIVSSENRVAFRIMRGLSLEYSLSAFRDSKTYTFRYQDWSDTVQNNDDNDRITVTHLAGLVAEDAGGWNARLYGELSEHIVNYLKRERSAQNISEQGYRLGLNFSRDFFGTFSFEEKIVADAQSSEYLYKTPRTLSGMPAYQRSLSSFCSGKWRFADTWELLGIWNESYYDNGRWFGRDYFDSSAINSAGRIDYYAIDEKNTDYSLEFGLAKKTGRYFIEGGCRVQDVFNRRFTSMKYENVSLENGYTIEPFAVILLTYNRLAFKGRVSRIINTLERDKWELSRNWDIRVVGQASW
jgi:hypothetical protein